LKFIHVFMISKRGLKTMKTEKIIKVAGLNTGIALVDTILFSPGLIGIQIGGMSVLATAFGATAIVMSAVAFAAGNYKLIVEKEKVIQTNEIRTTEDFINSLKQNSDKKTFCNDIETILEQIERLQKKNVTIKDILLQKFNSSEMSYSKFDYTIKEIENVFFINIKSILNKLNAFDEEDYKRIRKEDAQKKFSAEFIQEKIGVYNEYIAFIKNAIEDNEQIILKLDKLLLEISKLNSLEAGELENMSAFKEIDDLINKTKLYK
jgi:hypothetical protein